MDMFQISHSFAQEKAVTKNEWVNEKSGIIALWEIILLFFFNDVFSAQAQMV